MYSAEVHASDFEVFVLDAFRPREDGDFDVHVGPRVAAQEERELVFVASVEELLRRIAVDVGRGAEAAQHIHQVHAHHFDTCPPVYDGEDGIVLPGIVVDEARGHEVGVGDAFIGSVVDGRGIIQRLARGSPLLVRRIGQFVGLVHGVVPQQFRVAAVDAEYEMVGIDGSRMVEVVEGDVNLLRIACEGDRVARDLVEHHIDGLERHAMPERVERLSGIEDKAVGIVVEGDRQFAPILAQRRFVDAELRPLPACHHVERLLSGEDDILVASRLEVELHLIAILGELLPALGLREEENPVAVEDISRNRAHMVGKHIGPLQVVVVLEGEVQPAGARLEGVVDVGAGGKHESERDAG